MSVVRSGVIVSFLTLISRILGYIREIAVAYFLGTSTLADIFTVAFKFPNFFRRIFAEGGLATVFIPIYSRLVVEDHNKADKFSNQVFSLLLASLIFFTVIMEIIMPFVIIVIAPGFYENQEQYLLTIYLSRIMFPYLIFISLVAFLGSIFNTHNRFIGGAASPIILNVILIFGITVLSNYTSTPAHALAYSVIIAGIVQLIAMVKVAKGLNVNLKIVKPKLTNEVKQLFKNMVPILFATSITHINLFVDTIIASLLYTGAVSSLNYADRINQLPLAIIGIAISTVLLPILSKKKAEMNYEESYKIQNKSFEIATFFGIPSAVALFILADVIIYILFERGKFDTIATHQTYTALMAFSLGLPAFIYNKIYSSIFFAAGKNSKPVKYASIAMVINIFLNLALMKPLGHVGIALSTSISGWINVIMLAYAAEHLKISQISKSSIMVACKVVLTSLIMGIALMYIKDVSADLIFESRSMLKLLILIGTIGSGCLVFFFISHFLKIIDYNEIKNIFKKKKKIN